MIRTARNHQRYLRSFLVHVLTLHTHMYIEIQGRTRASVYTTENTQSIYIHSLSNATYIWWPSPALLLYISVSFSQ